MSLLKPVSILLAVIVVLLLVLTFVTGPIVGYYFKSHGRELLGRDIAVDAVSVNAFTGSAQLNGLTIGGAEGEEIPFVTVGEVSTRLSIVRLLFGTFDLSYLDIDNLQVEVAQRDTVFNFDDIIRHLGSDETDTGDSSIPLIIGNIHLRDSYIHYRDLMVGSDFKLNHFSLFVPGIDLREMNANVGAQLEFADGGTLSSDIQYDHRRRLYELQLKIDDFNLENMLPYVRQHIAVEKLEGLLNVDLSIKGSMSHLLNFTAKGTAGVRSLGVYDPDDEQMLLCDTLALGIRDMDLMQNRFNFSHAYLENPNIHIIYGKDSLNNFSRLVVEAVDEAEEETSVDEESVPAGTTVTINNKEKDLRLVVDRLNIVGGTIQYRDESLREEPFVYQVNDLGLTAPNFTLDGVNHFKASARLGREGRMKLQYDGKLDDHSNIHLNLMADSVDFKDFSPYTLQMFGNEVSQGKLSLFILADTRNGELSSQNRIILRDPRVEKRRRGVESEMNIPFRAGMYILTDKDNVLDIDLPVRGNIEAPEYSYKRLLFRTLGRLIVKVCTSPFRMFRGSSKVSAGEILEQDSRSIDSISLDNVNEDLMGDE